MNFYCQRRDGMEPDRREQALLRYAGEQVRHMGDGDETRELERQIAALRKFAMSQEDEG